MDKVLIKALRRRIHSGIPRLRDEQAHPLTVLLETPFHPANPLPPGLPHLPASTPPTEHLSPKKPATAEDMDTRAGKARVVFGSRLAGPGKRKEEKFRKGTIIAGVKVPPKPVEPDNCCMSGCVNCTWDIFREDLEEWRAALVEARVRLKMQRVAEGTSTSMNNNGDPPVGGMWEGFDDIPVGIKAFMETEKRLKETRKTMKAMPG